MILIVCSKVKVTITDQRLGFLFGSNKKTLGTTKLFELSTAVNFSELKPYKLEWKPDF